MVAPPSVTDLLVRAGVGDRDAFDGAFPLIYGELRRLARHHMRRESPEHTLSTTALVHEAYLRLVGGPLGGWHDHPHFLAIASRAMRRILVEHSRRASRAKRGGRARVVVPLDGVAELAIDERADLVVALDEALEKLAALDDRQARVIECRFFGGLTEEETALALGVGLRTVKRDWAKARSWLFAELNPTAVA